jgi:hypothetical protein
MKFHNFAEKSLSSTESSGSSAMADSFESLVVFNMVDNHGENVQSLLISNILVLQWNWSEETDVLGQNL